MAGPPHYFLMDIEDRPERVEIVPVYIRYLLGCGKSEIVNYIHGTNKGFKNIREIARILDKHILSSGEALFVPTIPSPFPRTPLWRVFTKESDKIIDSYVKLALESRLFSLELRYLSADPEKVGEDKLNEICKVLEELDREFSQEPGGSRKY